MVFRTVFFDLETTGRDVERDRIVEIAAFDPVNNCSFQQLVHPQVPIPKEVIAIHGINDDMVRDQPSFLVVAQQFIDFCHGEVMLVAHNAEAFDVPFLSAELRRHGLTVPTNWVFVDSLKWARKYRKDLPRHSLQYLREIFGIAKNTAHRALDDTMVLYQVFDILVNDLTCEEIMSRIDSVRASTPVDNFSPNLF